MLGTVCLTLHLIGLGLGFGGASVGDISPISMTRRRRSVPPELIEAVGRSIWSGLAILTLTGAALFTMHPSAYLRLSGFIAKMIMVAVLAVNGLILNRHRSYSRLDDGSVLLGSISVVSWYGSLLAAMFKTRANANLPLLGYLGIYAGAIVATWILARFAFRQWLPPNETNPPSRDHDLPSISLHE